jgi:hypothetical protein
MELTQVPKIILKIPTGTMVFGLSSKVHNNTACSTVVMFSDSWEIFLKNNGVFSKSKNPDIITCSWKKILWKKSDSSKSFETISTINPFKNWKKKSHQLGQLKWIPFFFSCERWWNSEIPQILRKVAFLHRFFFFRPAGKKNEEIFVTKKWLNFAVKKDSIFHDQKFYIKKWPRPKSCWIFYCVMVNLTQYRCEKNI